MTGIAGGLAGLTKPRISQDFAIPRYLAGTVGFQPAQSGGQDVRATSEPTYRRPDHGTYPTRTQRIDIEPPSKPVTGYRTMSSRDFNPST